ncbi:MAG: ABC transporter ATP-binding protein [Pseudomonadota bacterium]
MHRFFAFFENLVDPFVRPPAGGPSATGGGYIYYFARQMKLTFLVMLVAGFATALAEAMLFSFVGRLVDRLAEIPKENWFSEGGETLIWLLLAVLVARLTILFVNTITEEQVMVPGFFSLVRWQSHQRILRQDLAFFEDDLAGRIANKVWQSGMAAGDFMVSLLQVVWFILMYTVTTAIILSGMDWRLSAMVFVWLGLFSIIAIVFVPRIRDRAKDTSEAGSTTTGRMVDAYSNISTIKMFAAEDDISFNVHSAFSSFLASLKRFTRTIAGMRMLQATVGSTMIGVVAVLTMMLYVDDAISLGSVAVAMSLILRLNLLMGRMLGQLNGLFRNLGTAQNSAELVAKEPKVVDAPDAESLGRAKGTISFENISFDYVRGSLVINDLNLQIKPGEKVGIVGRSGAGKTTLIKLLLRLYDLDSGTISIDGHDIARVQQKSLRANFGVVSQDVGLLHRSVRDNIALGRPDAGLDDIREAACRANAHDFIETLADGKGGKGFDARVGERGVKLSGGQRQRIAIARVFLKDAPILILDEATSSLDSEVEAAIQENLFELMSEKTVIAIAHRLSTISALDRLVVMDEGKIVESGSHDELVGKDGIYAGLWARQTGGFIHTGRG